MPKKKKKEEKKQKKSTGKKQEASKQPGICLKTYLVESQEKVVTKFKIKKEKQRFAWISRKVWCKEKDV